MPDLEAVEMALLAGVEDESSDAALWRGRAGMGGTAARVPGSSTLREAMEVLVDVLPDVLRLSLEAVLEQQFDSKQACAVSAIRWAGWDQLVGEVLELSIGVTEEDVRLQLMLEALTKKMRGFVRIAADNAAMPVCSDEHRIAQLREHGWERKFGLTFGENNCLADSLLQLLVRCGVLSSEITEVQREEACAANRSSLQRSDPALGLRPRQRDAFTGEDHGEDDGAYLQHDVHAAPTVRFLIAWFRGRGQALRGLPASGIRLIVMSRFDSEVAPRDEVRICEDEGAGEAAPPLTLALYNLTGDGISGSHYDPLFPIAVAGEQGGGVVVDMSSSEDDGQNAGSDRVAGFGDPSAPHASGEARGSGHVDSEGAYVRKGEESCRNVGVVESSSGARGMSLRRGKFREALLQLLRPYNGNEEADRLETNMYIEHIFQGETEVSLEHAKRCLERLPSSAAYQHTSVAYQAAEGSVGAGAGDGGDAGGVVAAVDGGAGAGDGGAGRDADGESALRPVLASGVGAAADAAAGAAAVAESAGGGRGSGDGARSGGSLLRRRRR